MNLNIERIIEEYLGKTNGLKTQTKERIERAKKYSEDLGMSEELRAAWKLRMEQNQQLLDTIEAEARGCVADIREANGSVERLKKFRANRT